MDLVPRPDPAISPPPIEDYLATIVEIQLSDRTIVISPLALVDSKSGVDTRIRGVPTDRGESPDLQPGARGESPGLRGRTDGPREHLDADVVHLITAANPFSLPYSDEDNAVRNGEAARELDRLGVQHVPSLGRDRDATWTEPGFALLDADEDEVMRLAEAWSQHGIYRWDGDGWWLVLTDGSSPTSYPVEVAERPHHEPSQPGAR